MPARTSRTKPPGEGVRGGPPRRGGDARNSRKRGFDVRGVQHVNLTIPRGGEEQARSFYTTILSLKEIEKPKDLRVHGGLWYKVGELELHLSVEDGALVVPSRRHVGFIVDDLERARRFFESHGIATLPQADLPGWRRFFVHDPFGNRLEIQSPRRKGRE